MGGLPIGGLFLPLFHPGKEKARLRGLLIVSIDLPLCERGKLSGYLVSRRFAPGWNSGIAHCLDRLPIARGAVTVPAAVFELFRCQEIFAVTIGEFLMIDLAGFKRHFSAPS